MAQSAAKGDLALDVDEDELEASLTFTPDKDGAEWTAEKILRVLMDARIGGFNQKRAEELTQKFGRAKGKLKEVVASGTPAEPPRPELPEWADMPMPPELSELVASVAAEAPPPLLYKLRVETVKVERTVRKPGALPFLPPKVEKVQAIEKRERREQVFPDATVIRTGWASRGERVGILSQAKPGKPGGPFSASRSSPPRTMVPSTSGPA